MAALPNSDQYRCQVQFKKGRKKGQICNKLKVRHSNYCSYHKSLNKNNINPNQNININNSQITTKKYCNGCSNELDKSFSYIKLMCGHRFHMKCFMLLFEDEFGYVYKPNKCPLCDYDVNQEFEHTCSICLDDILIDVIKTKCNHYFHKECLKEWDLNNGCPNCRR